MNNYKVRDIAELGIFASLAIILNLSIFKIHITSSGGSISFVMIPLFIIAIRHPIWVTFIACGIVFGLPSCLISGNPFITYPLEYLLGFGSICIISAFRKLILSENKLSYLYLSISIVIATTIRYFFASIDGVLFYETKLIASLVYNAPYIYITGLIGLLVMILLLKPLKIINKIYSN